MSESSLELRRALRPVLILVFLGVCVGLFVFGGMPPMVLFMAACALSLTIFFLWSSLQQVDDSDEMDFEEALSLAAPSATEEQKRAILRTLKDLEYELSVGKISQEDFDQVSAQYRSEAKRLIYLADEEMKARLEHAERVVQKRLDRVTKKKAKSPNGRAEQEEGQPEPKKQQANADDDAWANEHDTKGSNNLGPDADSKSAANERDETSSRKSTANGRDETEQDDSTGSDSERRAWGGQS